MQVFYFLTPTEHFGLLKAVAIRQSVRVGLSFRRFSPSGFNPGYETCDWNDDLATKYVNGGYSEVYLSTNGSLPEHRQDWSFSDRELCNLLVIEGGRVRGNELEQAYLRVFAKQSEGVPLYQKIRRTLKDSTTQGLQAGRHHYADTFYSHLALRMKMVDRFGENEFVRPDHVNNVSR